MIRFFIPVLLSGCNGPYSALDAAGPSALAAVQLWWAMFLVATLVLLAVCVLVLYSLRGSKRDEPAAQKTGQRFIIGGGVVLPVVSIVALMIFGVPLGRDMLVLPPEDGRTVFAVHVLARQWSWQVSYAELGIVLENELHIPAGVPVDVHLRTADLIHSFWVPRLAGKLDTIPGRELVLRLQADEAGIYRGQCAEFCGLNHAHMKIDVHAHDAESFAQWQQTQAESAAVGTGVQDER